MSCAKAVHLAHDKYKKYPPYFGTYGGKKTPFVFHVHLLPYVDMNPLYVDPEAKAIVPDFLSSFDPSQTQNGAGATNFPVNLRLYYTSGPVAESVLTQEGGNPTLAFPRMPDSFKDGVSNTLLFATKYMNCGAKGGSMWMDPGNNAVGSPKAATFGASMALWQQAPSVADCDPIAGTAVSFTKDRILVALCDASTRTVSPRISPATWQAVHTPSAGDVVSKDWED